MAEYQETTEEVLARLERCRAANAQPEFNPGDADGDPELSAAFRAGMANAYRHAIELLGGEVGSDRVCVVDGLFNVGQLLEWLEGVDPDTQVVLDDRDGWYDNVERVIVPGTNADLREFFAVTLYPGAPVDSRQL